MSVAQKEYIHAPDASLDYGFDWSNWVEAGETITTSTWETDDVLTLSSQQVLDNVTSVFITGGVHNTSYSVTNHIITSLGKHDSRTIRLLCKIR